MTKIKSLALILGVLIMSFLIGYLVLAQTWSDAPEAPPGCPAGYPGCDAPLNVGPSNQTKSGALTIGGGVTAPSFYDSAGTYFVDPAGQAVTNYSAILAGNVGIGIVKPQWKLHVSSSSETVGLIESTGVNSYPNLRIKNDAQTWYFYNDGTQSGTSADMFGIHDGTAYRLAILTNGNVGIGTTSPARRLHVYESGDASKGIYIQNPNTGTSAQATLALESNAGDGYVTLIGSSFATGWGSHFADRLLLFGGSGASGVDMVSEAGDLRFYSGGYATGNERMRILSGGNVGIGTPGPSEKLDVKGDIRFTGDDGWDGGGDTAQLIIGDTNRVIKGIWGSGFGLETPINVPIWITTNNVERMRITGDGNVGIGTTGPGYKLDVAGKANATELCINGVCQFSWPVGGGGTVTSITFNSPLTGGTITTSGTVGITQASSTANGYLSSTDWNTFNNKLSTTSDYGRSGVSTTLYEGATALSSKYLGISARAADSDKLDNYHATTSGTDTTNIPVISSSVTYSNLRAGYASSAGNADTVDNYHATTSGTDTTNIPVISSSVTYSNLRAGYASSAGNADTVDNYHASDFARFSTSCDATNAGTFRYTKTCVSTNFIASILQVCMQFGSTSYQWYTIKQSDSWFYSLCP